MISRTLSKHLLQAAKSIPVVAITGPRQSGKTTLVKNTFANYPYLNLEDIELREYAKSDPKGFLQPYTSGLIIDEIQYVPELFSYIQVIVDERENNGMFILTGSQNFSLLSNVAQSLAGRVLLYELHPFSYLELGSTNFWMDNYEDFLFKGFYPRLYKQNLDPSTWLNSYVRTYVDRDLRQMINIGDLSIFQQFLKLCAARTGQILNLSSMGNQLGISYQTVKKWLSVLEASYIIYLLPPYYNNFNKRITKSPKLYFYDVGLASFLLGLRSSDQVKSHYLRGELFETLILSEIKKRFCHQGKELPLYYWRNHNETELDCVFQNGDQEIGIEIKSARTINNKFFSGLNYWAKLTGTTSDNLYLIYGGEEVQSRSVANVQGWKFLDLNLI